MSRTVYRYRSYCTTDQKYVYSWGLEPPVACVENTAHVIDTASTVVVDKIIENTSVLDVAKTPFEELFIAEKTPVMELKSMYGLSALRDIYTTNGGGTITNTSGDGEYRLRVQGASQEARMQSTERGRYIAGQGAEAGIGLRMPTAPTGNIRVKWGLFDDNNGLYYVRDAQGFGVCILRNGVETRVPQSAFNYDRLDGIGPSGTTHDFADGHIYQIMFAWYGYGIIKFLLSGADRFAIEQKQATLHTHFPEGATSIKDPNLPLRVEITSGAGDASDFSVYVSGRQYSILGKYSPIQRINAAYRTMIPVTDLETFQPILTVRKKAGYASNSVKINSIDYVAFSYMVLQLRVNTTVVGGTYTNIPDQDPAETVIELNTTASSASGGIVVWTAIAPTDRVGMQQIAHIGYILPEYQTLTLMAKPLQTSNGCLTTVLRWTEEW